MVKHTFATEYTCNRDAIHTSDKLLLVPHFNGMGMTQMMEFVIRCLHFRSDPGAFAAGMRCGTVRDDLGKGVIKGDPKRGTAAKAAH